MMTIVKAVTEKIMRRGIKEVEKKASDPKNMSKMTDDLVSPLTKGLTVAEKKMFIDALKRAIERKEKELGSSAAAAPAAAAPAAKGGCSRVSKRKQFRRRITRKK